MYKRQTGNYGGLGIEVTLEDGFVKVIAPMDGTPAERANIEAGDVIIQLNDNPVRGLSLTEAIDIMRGEPGSEIKLLIIREGQSTPKEVVLVREIINVPSVTSRVLELGYSYLRIAQFQSGTGREALTEITNLSKENNLKGLVIDLRDNPGGILQSAVEVADIFIDEGLIVYTEGRLANAQLRFSATAGDTTNGIPIVLLVNQGTASASEIVAGALQDHRRAIIMGTKSFGKGSVQTILPSGENVAIKLTTARYYTPSGRLIQRPYEDGNDLAYYRELYAEDRESKIDSLKLLRPKYKTKSGRTVYGGGGITPDSYVSNKNTQEEEWNDLILNSPLISNFVFNELDQNRKAFSKLKEVQLLNNKSSSILPTYEQFSDYCKTNGIEFKNGEKETLKAIRANLALQLFGENIYNRIKNQEDVFIDKAIKTLDTL